MNVGQPVLVPRLSPARACPRPVRLRPVAHGAVGARSITSRAFPGRCAARAIACCWPRLSPTSGIADRAAQLKAFIDRESPDEPVHLFGHSMGGLDSRHMISRLGMASRVLSLTTLGSPHRGSPFADWAVSRFTRVVGPMFDHCGHSAPGVRRPDRGPLQEVQRRDARRAGGALLLRGRSPSCRTGRAPPWGLTAPIVASAEGPNDGIVSIASATWGEACDVWDADHMNLVNWPYAVGVGEQERPHPALCGAAGAAAGPGVLTLAGRAGPG